MTKSSQASVAFQEGPSISCIAKIIDTSGDEDAYVLYTDLSSYLETRHELSSGEKSQYAFFSRDPSHNALVEKSSQWTIVDEILAKLYGSMDPEALARVNIPDNVPEKEKDQMLASSIREYYGHVAFFGVMDGHSTCAKRMESHLLPALAEELKMRAEANSNVLDALRSAASNFTRRFHLALRELYKKLDQADRGGASLSFILVTKDWTIQGNVGNCPLAVVTTDGLISASVIQEASEIRYGSKILGRDAKIEYDRRAGNSYIGFPYGMQESRPYNVIGSFYFDADYQALYYELQKGCSDERREEIKAELGCFYQAFTQTKSQNPFFYTFRDTSTQFSDHRSKFIFDAKADIIVHSTRNVGFAVMCSYKFAKRIDVIKYSVIADLKAGRNIDDVMYRHGSERLDEDRTLVLVKFNHAQ